MTGVQEHQTYGHNVTLLLQRVFFAKNVTAELNPITIKVYKDIVVWQEDKTVGVTGFQSVN